ncbi:esterase [Edwardsiella ictaluri]|uniref:esterase n=1 Tax=Edwardsiella ictaluri TaxID=67780 RepID=UPI003783E43E
MEHHHHVVQQPTGTAQQLILLFHAVGDNPVAMGQIGEYFARAFPLALVVSVGSPEPSPDGAGLQWYAQEGEDDESRPGRIAAALPRLIALVRHWQRVSGVGYAATALVGFSQGATMALEAVRSEPDLAGRVIAFSGRFATLPQHKLGNTVVHLLHGSEDPRVSLAHAQEAELRLRSFGTDVTLDIEPVGHAINAALMEAALERMRTYIPQRYWDEALSGKRGEIVAYR